MKKSKTSFLLAFILLGCFSTEPEYWGSFRKLSLAGIVGEYTQYSSNVQEPRLSIQNRSLIHNQEEFNKNSLVPLYPKFDFILWKDGTLRMVFEESYVDEVEQSEWINKDTLACFQKDPNLFRCPFKMIGAHSDTIDLNMGRNYVSFSANYLFKVDGNGGYIYFYSHKPNIETDTTIKAWNSQTTHLFSGLLTYR